MRECRAVETMPRRLKGDPNESVGTEAALPSVEDTAWLFDGTGRCSVIMSDGILTQFGA
jgi:hypothetical protein